MGKYANLTIRVYTQAAWAAWGPTGRPGGTLFLGRAGTLFGPVGRDTNTTITNKPTVEGHPDMSRGLGTGYVVSRSTGVGFRGWALDKKLGFRGGVYEGARPSAASPLLNPKSPPNVAAFPNYDTLRADECRCR